uniref:Tc1-like transposase DDE domain-containing protein n=1 Tax=Acanthochromis polyacanthus TaxID=80966 RepID=A0A3Q1GCC1_9TELE
MRHDNDLKHSTKKWSLQSPDLTPIENLWEILNYYRDKSSHIKNEEELWEDCQSTWSKITGDICRKLVEFMAARSHQAEGIP